MTESKAEACARALGWEKTDDGIYVEKVGILTKLVRDAKTWDPERNAQHTEVLLEDLKRRGFNVGINFSHGFEDALVAVSLESKQEDWNETTVSFFTEPVDCKDGIDWSWVPFVTVTKKDWKQAVVDAYLKAREGKT